MLDAVHLALAFTGLAGATGPVKRVSGINPRVNSGIVRGGASAVLAAAGEVDGGGRSLCFSVSPREGM